MPSAALLAVASEPIERRAGLVVDDERLPERVLQLLRDEPRGDIGWPARGQGTSP